MTCPNSTLAQGRNRWPQMNKAQVLILCSPCIFSTSNSTPMCICNQQSYSKSSPPHSREFEFQMSFNPQERETTTSPANALFYKGKLLPLHLPPCLQVVQKLLQSSTNSHGRNTDASEESLAATVTRTTIDAANPPFESCYISPADSCHVSEELSPEDYTSECSAELTRSQTKTPWSRKLKLIKQSSLSLKLKASKAYLKSLFTTKSRCPDDSNASMKDENCSNGCLKADKNNSFVQSQKERWLMADTNPTTLMRSIEREKLLEEQCIQRKSFSGAISWYLTPRSSAAISSCSSSSSSSSFSSVNSKRFYVSQMLTRNSSVNSEMESSIKAAIAYLNCNMEAKKRWPQKNSEVVGQLQSVVTFLPFDLIKILPSGFCSHGSLCWSGAYSVILSIRGS